MLASDLVDAYLSGEFDHIFETQEDFDPGEIQDHPHFLEIAESGVFPVRAISSKFNRDTGVVDLNHDDGRDLGQLLLLKGKVVDDFYSLSLTEFLAYLSDVERESFGEPGHVFSKDFLVTSDVSAAEYDECLRAASDIWGGFSHYPGPQNANAPFENILANSKIVVPSTHHSEAFARYTYAQNTFERFLRLYHCVELLFDTITVLRIKKLTGDIRSLSTILSAHESKEVDRLIAISNDFIFDHEGVAKMLTLISPYVGVSKIIFDDHSKHGNPIPPSGNPPRWAKVVSSLSAGRYKETDLKADGALKNQEDYRLFVAKLSAYWIYRVRCSIAHSRIGEFILTDTDNDFVRCFAEPLLLEFCKQIFSSQALRDLL